MSIEVKVPQLPESVEDATVSAWHKQPGDQVARDENLVDLETDKVMLEVPSPSEGVLGEIKAQEGEVVKPGDVIALLEESAAGGSRGRQQAGSGGAGQQAEEDTDEAAGAEREPEAEAAESGGGQPGPLSPAVRRLVEENDLDPSRIKGTGKGGRLTKGDVLAYMESDEAAAPQQGQAQAAPQSEAAQPARSEAPASEPRSQARGGAAAAEPQLPEGRERLEQRVPMTRLRARIAERLVQAQQNAAILTTFNEVDLQAVNDIRRRYRDKFEQEHGVRLGFMSFFVKAAVEALKRFPVVNASIDGSDIVYHGYFDIGIAIASPRGLVVPILRDADQLGFAEIEKQILEFTEKARESALTLDDLAGGTFSITNGGVFGSLVSTPILNPPQSAILGMHTIQQRPVVRDGEIVVRPMMYLAVSYDHRLIDGKEAVQFLVAIKELLEDPSRLMLQI
ncbi:MAG TPA: 2-oxoglutarate dehydrogenase complex dihydrolipoyllysine-residue succinyltransferase [Gammaproteobacteria bacterium]|nr:2-oxoglutarate dehydrogenase complex dihydrolipoyllysine-residue succinyltransferase [Gammaproteobacteria bacterium]